MKIEKKIKGISKDSDYNIFSYLVNSFAWRIEQQEVDSLKYGKLSTILERTPAQKYLPVLDDVLEDTIKDAININYSNTDDIELCRAISTYMKNKKEVLV